MKTATDGLGEFEFGSAIGIIKFDEPIKRYKLARKIVRLDKEQKTAVKLMVEVHINFVPKIFGTPGDLGAMLAFLPESEPGERLTLNGIGLGLNYSLFPLKGSSVTKKRINVGVLRFSQQAQVLRDDFLENQPLPSDETEIQTKEITIEAWLIIISYTIVF